MTSLPVLSLPRYHSGSFCPPGVICAGDGSSQNERSLEDQLHQAKVSFAHEESNYCPAGVVGAGDGSSMTERYTDFFVHRTAQPSSTSPAAETSKTETETFMDATVISTGSCSAAAPPGAKARSAFASGNISQVESVGSASGLKHRVAKAVLASAKKMDPHLDVDLVEALMEGLSGEEAMTLVRDFISVPEAQGGDEDFNEGTRNGTTEGGFQEKMSGNEDGDGEPGAEYELLDGEWTWEKIKDRLKENPGRSVCVVAGAGGLAVVATPGIFSGPALWLLGFGPGGVVAGSWAASIHSTIGIVAAGSKFAIMQSAGAGGAGLAIVNSAIQGGAWVVAGMSALYTGVNEFLSDDDAKESEGEQKPWFESWL
ncbi:hypothetical protein GE09DRAFT_568390 [Coniochaeta sp. 2T2.1]|nr:hypothetical protein GE09DRAFT_568390 [Coniochaeta sp. 2T2.1]